MHWVDRGLAPNGLEGIRNRYTPGWVRYYRHGVGDRPVDGRWRDFHEDLSRAFHGLCVYCEEFDKGEVEHFYPKKRFPELVYEWSNWLFACHACNQLKGDKWPTQGYIDPCDQSIDPLIDHCFDFDFVTGRIKTRKSLPDLESSQAQAMINDLRLNAFHHLQKRVTLVEVLSQVFQKDSTVPNPGLEQLRLSRTSRSAELSSIVRAWLSAQGYP